MLFDLLGILFPLLWTMVVTVDWPGVQQGGRCYLSGVSMIDILFWHATPERGKKKIQKRDNLKK